MLWDDSTTIRAVSVATSGRADGSELSAQEMLGDDLGDPQTLPSGNLLVVGKEFQEEIDGEQIWVVPVAAAAPNELLSLYFHSRARGRLGWVAETAATVERLA